MTESAAGISFKFAVIFRFSVQFPVGIPKNCDPTRFVVIVSAKIILIYCGNSGCG